MSRALAASLLITALIAWFDAPLTAAPADDFESANQRYRAGDFAAAEAGYQGLIDAGQMNADLLYNLGNTSFRLGRPGEAVLWFERALTMDPTHVEARQNLRYLKRTGGLLQFDSDNSDSLINAVRGDTVLRVATVCGWLSALGAVAALSLRLGSGAKTILWIASPLLAIVTGVAIYGLILKQQRQDLVSSLAIVTAEDTKALTAPARAASPIIELPPGSEMVIVSDRGDWSYVELPGELRAWVARDAIQPLWPYGSGLMD